MKMSIREFPPLLFASVMGTGVVAAVSYAYSRYIPVLSVLGIVLAYLNTLLFFTLLIPWCIRWIKYREDALHDLYHPVVSHFYGTIAIAMLVLAVDYVVIIGNTLTAWIFWICGTIATIIFSATIPYLMFVQEKIGIENITPAWYIPPVGLIVVPMAGALLLKNTTGLLFDLMLFVNYSAWGSGFFLYVALYAICMYRYITHQLPSCNIAPTIWINLGPIGAGVSSLYMLVKNTFFITYKEPLYVFGLIFWGFGVWWLIMAIIITLHYIKKISLPYSLAWWAFIFPLGAYVSATHNVAIVFGIEVIDYIGLTLYFMLLGMWIITVLKTFMHVVLAR